MEYVSRFNKLLKEIAVALSLPIYLSPLFFSLSWVRIHYPGTYGKCGNRIITAYFPQVSRSGSKEEK